MSHLRLFFAINKNSFSFDFAHQQQIAFCVDTALTPPHLASAGQQQWETFIDVPVGTFACEIFSLSLLGARLE